MVSKKVRQLVLGAVVVFGFAAEQAVAQTTFNVSATVNANCRLDSATNINHDVYDPLAGADDDATGTITVRCTKDTPYTLALDVGTGGGTFTTRTLSGPGGTLDYNLYRDPARSEVWGNGTGSFTVSDIGGGLGIPQQKLHTVYSRIPTNQVLAVPGAYSSTIQVSITY